MAAECMQCISENPSHNVRSYAANVLKDRAGCNPGKLKKVNISRDTNENIVDNLS